MYVLFSTPEEVKSYRATHENAGSERAYTTSPDGSKCLVSDDSWTGAILLAFHNAGNRVLCPDESRVFKGSVEWLGVSE